MKKLILTIGLLMFLSAPFAPLMTVAENGNGDEDENPCDSVFDTITEDMSCYNLFSTNKDWNQVFGEDDPTKVGQNLYKLIYNKTVLTPNREALELTAEKYAVTPSEMASIVNGSIRPILARRPSMTIDMADKMHSDMLETFDQNLSRVQMEASIKSKVEASEVFANGKLADSGFDLINDLENIEIILFQQNEPLTFPTGGGSRSGGGDDSGAPPSITPASVDPVLIDLDSGPIPLGSGGSSGTDSGDTTSEPDEDVFPGDSGADEDEQVEPLNPLACFTDGTLERSLESFAKAAAQNKDLYDGSSDQDDQPEQTEDDEVTVEGDGPSVRVPSGLDEPAGIDVDLATSDIPGVGTGSDSTPAEAGDWTKVLPCKELFCLTIEMIKEPVTLSYQQRDNCIHCHVQYINSELQETYSADLIPAKVPGNLGESDVCKNASGTAIGSIGLNIAFTIVPIVTPVKDDMIQLSNIKDQWSENIVNREGWEEFQRRQRESDEEPLGTPEPIVSVDQRYVLMALEEAPPDATQTEVWEIATGYQQEAENSAAEALLFLEVSNEGYGGVQLYQVLLDEMTQMNKYFETFMLNIRGMHEEVPGVNATLACKLLNEKKECT